MLSLPAIWQGASITRALAQTLAIVRSRLVEAVLLLVLLGFISFAVGLIIFGVLAAGLVPTLGMSVSIVGFGGYGMESLMAMSQGGGAHAIAGAIGGALLWAVAASLVGQVYLLGLSLVYLRVTEGLDLTASEEALRAKFDDARRRTAEFGEKARQATQRDATAAAAGGGAAAAGTASDAGGAAPPAYSPPPAVTTAPAAFDPGTSDPFRLRAGRADDDAAVGRGARRAIPTLRCRSTMARRPRRRRPCRRSGRRCRNRRRAQRRCLRQRRCRRRRPARNACRRSLAKTRSAASAAIGSSNARSAAA